MTSFKSQQGQIFILAIVVLTVVLINSLLIISGALVYSQNAKFSTRDADVTNLAEAGIDKAVASLNATAGSYTGELDTPLGDGTISTSVAPLSGSTTTYVITSTGYIPSSAKPLAHKTVSIQVSKGTGISFNYALQSGAGGLTMANGATVNGSVYSNGNITMSNTSVIAGDAFVAGGTQASADQQSDCTDPNCQDFIFGKNVSGQNILDAAQSFKPSSSSVLNKVTLKLKKFGNPSNLTVRLMADNGGSPNKGSVLASGTLFANLVTNSYSMVEVDFTTPPNLTAGTVYWIMIATLSADSSNYWAWSEDTSQGYNGGSPAWSSNWQAGSPAWTAIPSDLGFQTFMGGVVTSIIGTNGSKITGNAHAHDLENLTVGSGAYYQTETNVTAGALYPSQPDPASQSFAISQANIDNWETQAASQGVYTGDITSCPTNLPAGKYVGNINLGNDCNVRVESPIEVTGNLNLGNDNTFTLSSSYGSSSGVFIVDKFITLSNNNIFKGDGTSGSYLFLISNYDTQDDPLKQPAITLTNNGNNGVVYSILGAIDISNNNDLTVVSGWQLNLSNNVIVNYSSGLASAFVSSGPSGGFSVIKGTYQVK